MLVYICNLRRCWRPYTKLSNTLISKRHSFRERFGGKPSAYTTPDIMKSMSGLLQKPRAQYLVYHALKENNILYEVERFMLAALYIALKKRPKERRNILMVQNIMNATSSYPIKYWEAKSLYEQTYKQIAKLDGSQIEEYAGQKATESVERRKDDAYFLTGLFAY